MFRSQARDSPGETSLDALVARTDGPQPGRRLFHAANGVGIWGILRYSEIPAAWAVALLSGALLLALGLDLFRLRSPRLNHLFFRYLSPLASPREREGIASSTWYLLGITLAVALFPRPVAEASILVLALADPSASWFGRRYGRARFGSGTRLGSFLFWSVSAAVLWPLFGPLVALTTATGVTLLEAAPWRADDNLVIPMATGAGLLALTALLG